MTIEHGNLGGGGIPHFLSRLSPGIGVQLQYDHQPPASGTFQGFEDKNVILTDYDNFPGLVRIAPDRINAVSPFSGYAHDSYEHDYKEENREEKCNKRGESTPKLYI